MGTRRRNTVVVDVSIMPVRPKPAVVKRFLEEKIQLDMMQVKSIQLHNVRNNTLIEMYNAEAADLLAEEHNLKHSFEHNNKLYRIPVYVDDGATNVKVHDLPPDFSNDRIVKHMRQFGEVFSIVDDKWTNFFPGIRNGVRVLRMRLCRGIPSYIEVDNEKTLVTYTNQTPTCRHCGRQVHFTMKCSEAAKQDRKTTQPERDSGATLPEISDEEFPALPVRREILESVELLNPEGNPIRDITNTDDNLSEQDMDETNDGGSVGSLDKGEGGSRSISPIDYQYLEDPDNTDGKVIGDDDVVYRVVKQRKSRSRGSSKKNRSKSNEGNGEPSASRSRSNTRNGS